MKFAEWKRVVRPLLPEDQSWEFRGRLAYRQPVNRVLIGALGEESSFDKGVYIWRVSMPLFVPIDVVDLSWSARVGGGANKVDAHDDDALTGAIASALEVLESEDDVLRQIVARGADVTGNRRVDETIGYAQLLLGDADAARMALARARSGVGATPWGRDVVERAALISRLVDEQGVDAAVGQLDEWCNRTAGALGLDRGAR